MIYMVLGMHKSGTTLVSRIMHHSGINMGEHIPVSVSYDDGNKYERQSTLRLNMDILGTEDESMLELPKPEMPVFTERQQNRMDSIIEECNKKYDKWGFKDPRTPLILSCWLSKLPEHKLIAIYRHPGEIWPRYNWIGFKKYYKNPILAWQFIRRWQEHNMSILEYLKNTDSEFLLLNYSELVSNDNEFLRLQSFLGTSPSDQRSKALYRSKKRDWKLLNGIDLLASAFGYQKLSKTLSELDELRQSQL